MAFIRIYNSIISTNPSTLGYVGLRTLFDRRSQASVELKWADGKLYVYNIGDRIRYKNSAQVYEVMQDKKCEYQLKTRMTNSYDWDFYATNDRVFTDAEDCNNEEEWIFCVYKEDPEYFSMIDKCA